ncbi:uncharacterized protein LOC113240584 [Hyposmocoma kahamanoa]|uniref:uncharacterized protein LOC113240584 n=1 Tax=Hyposmocoma kahamanoa TaxID=1477025 RepID=UPI000E6D8B09|nr:uncharacterized protein LOC113240584 [Hyposmocoma kahamanoa]
MSTTPEAALNALLDLTPLHLFIQREASTSMYRLTTRLRSRWLSQTLRSAQDSILEHSVLGMTSDVMLPKQNFKILYQVEFPTKEDWETNSHTWKDGSLLWYTDWSKMGPNVGCGIHGVRPRLSYKLNKGRYSSIFQAEVYAIITCADLNLKRGYFDKHIYINSYSQAALHALASVTQTSRIIDNCVNILNTLGESNIVVLRWVPGHSDIEGNESADELTKAGAREAFIGPEPFIGIAYSLAKFTVLNESTHLSREAWLQNKGLEQLLNTGTTNRQIESDPDKPDIQGDVVRDVGRDTTKIVDDKTS